MDPRTFDTMIRRLSGSRSRRSLVGGSLGASVLAAIGLSDDALARKTRVRAEACIPTGKRCSAKKPRGKKGKRLSCDDCCQGRVVQATNSKGKTVNKCACKPSGLSCTRDTAYECCSGICAGGVCSMPSPSPVCVADGQSCTNPAQCCSGFCGDGICRAAFCSNLGENCLPVGVVCCSDTCDDDCCLPTNAACDTSTDANGFCCNGRPCTGGFCQP